jgi:hypothetical protein
MTTFVPEYVDDMGLEALTVLTVEGPPVTVELGLVRQPGGSGSNSVDALAVRLRDLTRQLPGQ